jgi:hypothetical protein
MAFPPTSAGNGAPIAQHIVTPNSKPRHIRAIRFPRISSGSLSIGIILPVEKRPLLLDFLAIRHD